MISFYEYVERMDEVELIGEKPRSNNILYVGAMLTRKSQIELWEMVKTIKSVPDDWKKFCHHMTIRFKPTEDQKLPVFGEDLMLLATEISEDENCIVVEVKVDKTNLNMPSNQIPHITIATAPKISPVYSNELLRKNIGVRLPNILRLSSFVGAKMTNGAITPERKDIALENF